MLYRALLTLLTGLATGLLSGGISKAISGNGLFLQKHGKCYQVQKFKVMDSTWLPINLWSTVMDCSWDISDGAGLLMGKNIPVLEWLL